MADSSVCALMKEPASWAAAPDALLGLPKYWGHLAGWRKLYLSELLSQRVVSAGGTGLVKSVKSPASPPHLSLPFSIREQIELTMDGVKPTPNLRMGDLP